MKTPGIQSMTLRRERSGQRGLLPQIAQGTTRSLRESLAANGLAQGLAQEARECRNQGSMGANVMKTSRRSFLIVTTGLASSLVLGHHASADVGQVSESDANAQALGYKTDATKVDKARFPKYQAGQTCASCQFFQGKPGEAMGPCQIFAGKLVDAKGWCSSYVKKA